MSDDSGGVEGEWDSASGTAGGEWSRTLASVVADPLYQADEEWRLTAVNDALVELTGRDREALLGEHVSVLFDRSDVGRSELARRRVDYGSGDVETVGVTVETADGNAVPCQLRVGAAAPDGRETVCQLLVEWDRASSGDDATPVEDRPDEGSHDGGLNRALERQRDELKAELDEVFERVTDAVHGLDEEFRFTYLNEQAEEVLGRTEAELLGQYVWDEFPEAQEGYRERYERAMETQEPIRFEEYSEAAGGWLEVRAYPSESGLSVYFRDITDRREREAEVRRERDRAQTYLELAGSMMVLVDDVGRVSYVNQRACEVLGYDKTELVGKNWFETCIPTRTRDELVDVFDSIMAGELESLETYENPIVTADGDERIVKWHNTILRDEHGTPTGTLSAGTDVTEQKRRAERLEQYSEFLDQFYRVSTRSDRTFDQKVERLLSAGCDHLDFDIGVLAEIDGTDYHIQQVSDATGSIHVGDTYPLENTYCELTIQRAQPLGFESASDADLGAHPCYREFGLRSYLAMAVHVDGELYGTLSFSSPTPRGREITELDRTLLTLLAQWVGYELERRARERELEESRQRYRTLVENFPNGAVTLLDRDLRYVIVGGEGIEQLGIDPTALEGAYLTERLPAELRDQFEPRYRAALEGDPQQFEFEYNGAVRWTHIHPVRDADGAVFGALGMSQDVTEQRERERELEQYEKVTETVQEGICVLNTDSEFVMVNDTFVAMTGYDRDELLGTHASLVRPASLNERFEAIQHSLAAGSELETIEMEIENADGNTRIIDARYGLFPREDGTTGRVGVWRDVTEQRERERQLARFERAVEASGHAIYMTDAAGTITYVNQAFEETTGYSAAEAIGETPSILQSGKHDAEYYENLWETVLAGEVWEEEIIDRRKSGELYHAEQTIAPVTNDDGEIDRMIAVQTDVTDRKEREEELQTRVEQQKGVTRLGQHALGTDDLDSLFDEAVEMVADTLGNEFAKVLEAEPEADRLHLRAGVGWRDGLVGEATVEDDLDSQAGYTLNSAEPVVVPDLDAETRFTGPELLTSHGVSSGISVVIGTPAAPWGVLGTHDTDVRSFSEQDVNFVQNVANILTTAIERVEHEGEIRRQRERLAALNQVNGIVRDIIRALLQQSTRAEVEQLVCERLAGSDSYTFAWIGELAGETDEVCVRTEAGVEGYLDDVTITVDDSETSRGATGKAFRSGEMQVTRDVLTEPEYETWRDHVQQYGFRSSAAIPIVHESTTYGTLNVYADRPDAFTGEERAVFEQLGDVMGHAINAIERKRLLMSDEVVEIDVRIRDVFEALGVVSRETGSIRFTRTVPVGDDSYVVYGTATDRGIETMTTLTDHLDHWTEFTVIDEDGDRRFELHMVEPPATSIVAAQGGRIQTASIEDGNYAMTVELPPEAPIRDVIDDLRDIYDGAELLAQRKTVKDASTTRQLKADLSETLTDRQLAALEAAYFAGFFEWPRASNGEDVADALDVSPPTFHQHLRGAERRLLETLLEDSGTNG